MKKGIKSKQGFVENELCMALQRADNRIDEVIYDYDEEHDLETVLILYRNGSRKEVNVTGDSKLTIMFDVASRLLTK